MSRPECAGCTAPIRKGQVLCAGCWATAGRAFMAAYPYTDPTSHVRNRNRFYGDRDVLLPAIRAELAASERGAA